RILGLRGRKLSIQTPPQGTGAVPHVTLEGWRISRPGEDRRGTTADPILRSRKGVKPNLFSIPLQWGRGRLRVKSTPSLRGKKSEKSVVGPRGAQLRSAVYLTSDDVQKTSVLRFQPALRLERLA